MISKIKGLRKILLPSLLVVLVTIMGVVFLGNKTDKKVKTKEQLRLLEYNKVEENDEVIDGTSAITFDAFFLKDINGDNVADGIRGTSNLVGKTDKLWLELKVLGDVKLKNASISFENSNVLISGSITKGNSFKQTINSTNITSIPLNELENGTTLLFTVNVNSNLTNLLSSYTGDNKVILKGTVVDNEGNETKIEKEVKYQADWYIENIGSSVSSKYHTNYQNPYRNVLFEHVVDDFYCYYTEYTGGNIVLTYDIETYVYTNTLVKSANIKTVIPKLNGYDALSAKVVGVNVTSEYDEDTKVLTAKREAVLENDLIKEKAYAYDYGNWGTNTFRIVVEYPVDAGLENKTVPLPVEAWYEIYNNQGANYENVIESQRSTRIINLNYEKPLLRDKTECEEETEVEMLGEIVSVGKYSNNLQNYFINKTPAINVHKGIEVVSDKTTYEVKYNTFIRKLNRQDNIKSFTISDNGADKFNGQYSMENFTSYKSILITNASKYLGPSGKIKIINNETDEVIHVLTAFDWNNRYYFEGNVRSIRLETSEIIDTDGTIKKHMFADNHVLNIFGITIEKEIDNQGLKNTYTLEELNSFNYIEASQITSFETELQGITENDIVRKSTMYRETNSSAMQLELSQNNISTTEETPMNIKLTTKQFGDTTNGWIDGEFLVMMPSGLLDFEINNVSINNSSVRIDGYEKVEINGQKGIRIITSNELEASYTITINTKVIPDATLNTKNYSIIAYGYNPYSNLSSQTANDIYDIDLDNDKTEKMNTTTTTLTIAAPSEMITTTTLKNYDSLGSITTSPMIAEVNPIVDDSAASIEITVNNNSTSYDVKNIRVLGKLGFTGNKYQIGEGELGSEFDVTMTDEGIKVPEEIKDKVKVYYSEEPEPTEDINDANNGWTETPADFDKIKTYMIIIDSEYVLVKGNRLVFTYDIEMPNKTENLLKKTYFNHGVYFDIVTDAGNYESSVGGSKLGIMMARKYDFEITNKKINTERGIVTRYELEDSEGNKRYVTTNKDGIGTIKGLYVNEEYKLKQVSINSSYEEDSEVKTFKVSNDANNNLVLTNTGTYKRIAYNDTNTLEVELESNPKYQVIIKNTDIDTMELIPGTTFKVTGKGINKYVSTNNEGTLLIDGLYVGEEYVVEETYNKEHLKQANSFGFKLIRNEQTGEVEIAILKLPRIVFSSSSNLGYVYNQETNGYDFIISDTVIGYNASLYLKTNLTDFTEKYQVSFDTKIYDPTSSSIFEMSVFGNGGYKNAMIIYDSSDYVNNKIYKSEKIKTATIKDADNNIIDSNINGGILYNIQFKMIKKASGSTFAIENLKLEPIDGSNEYLETTEKSNVETYQNPNVLQSIVDGENQDSPVLTIEVKSKVVPTYTLELTKQDSETGKPLAGAQYKITGPGLPETGKFLTTDENGRATVKLFKNFNDPSATINYYKYSEVETEYTIEEIVAPVGYMLDNKSVTFKVVNYIEKYTYNNGVYIVDYAENPIHYIVYGENSETEFESSEYDENNNIYKVVMEDYPIVTINKKDLETGEVLPNTLFVIYNYEIVNGFKVLTPAKDVDGNIIGEEIEIDGKKMFVVATDSNGKLNLNLSSGKYMLKEIQAADDKYEIDDQEYYFGIGETVPYGEAGVKLLNAIIPENYNYYKYNDSFEITPTSDGGWISTAPGKLIKYSPTGEVEWEKEIYLEYFVRDTNTYAIIYPDNPDRVEFVIPKHLSKTQSSFVRVVESSDGGYFVNGNGYDGGSGIVAKLDKDGNQIWQSEIVGGYRLRKAMHYVPYEGNMNADGKVAQCSIDYITGEWSTTARSSYNQEGTPYYVELEDYMKRDDETYYCGFESQVDTSHPYNWGASVNDTYKDHARIQAAQDGGVYQLVQMEEPGEKQYLYMADGTLEPSLHKLRLLKYDKDGNLIGNLDVVDAMEKAQQAYMEKYNIESLLPAYYQDQLYSSNFVAYPNGDVLVFMYYGSLLKLRFNEETNKFDTLWYTPIGFNGYGFMSEFWSSTTFPIQPTEDGGFVLKNTYSTSPSVYVEPFGDNLKLDDIEDYEYYYYSENNNGHNYASTAIRIFRFEEIENADGTLEAKLADVTVAHTSDKNENEVLLYGNRDNQRVPGSNSTSATYMLDDGSYIVSYYFDGSGSLFYRTIMLKDGTKFVLESGDFVIYKLLPTGEIEWIKRYRGMTRSSDETPRILMNADKTKLIIPANIKANTTVEEVGNENAPVITNPYSKNVESILFFDLNNEVISVAPEAYTLNINNSRKEYKIDITTDVGGEVTVKNGDNTVYSGTPETTKTIEKVKYGDDNLYDIIIKPTDGYVITNVTVNGEDIGYTVNDDLSVTIDKIKDIKEDKNIEVSIERGLSTVIVHHYLENTEEKAFSDEILTGMILTPYETSPKTSNLYSLITDSNGEYIIPENYKGMYTTNPIEVVYYYKENNVDLKVNYYVNETEIELAPSLIETKVLGAKYQTSALDIEFYELARVIGEEEGTLDKELTEVTYLYNELTEATIKVKHVDKETEKEIAPSESFVVDRYAEYETKASSEIPVNYRYVSRTSNAIGKAESDTIEVIYYYEVIPFNVEVDTKIDTILINGEKTTISDNKLAKIEPDKEDNVIVYYEVTVKNTGDIKATMKLEQSEIEGFEIYDLKEFTKEEDKYVINLELEAGEEVTYKIGYKWNQERYGESDSITKLVDVKNSLGFEEPNNDDNISETKLIVGVKTGMNFNMLGLIIGSIITSGLIVFMILRRRIRA